MSETVNYTGKLPVTEKQVVEWILGGAIGLNVQVEVPLHDLIDGYGWDGLNDYVDEVLDTSLTDLDYGVNHAATGARNDDVIVLSVTGNFDPQQLWKSDICVKFFPEAWQNDYTVPVDPQGTDVWGVAEVTANLIADAKRRGGDLDFVQFDPFAPEWVKGWGGPFTITVVDDQA